MNLRPLHDRVVIKRPEEELKSAGGIVIPSSVNGKQDRGTVVAVGDGSVASDGSIVPMSVSVGDVVWFDQHAGTEVKVDGEELLVMHEESIIGIIEG